VLFHSATFLVTVSLLVVAFWLTPSHRLRLVWLFAASVVFYGWSHWPSVFLLLGSIGVNYALGLRLGRAPSKRPPKAGNWNTAQAAPPSRAT
jgi:hypothetical protein